MLVRKKEGGITNLEFLLLASQVRLGRDAHSNDGKTSLKWLKCRKELGSNELNTASAGFETNVAEWLTARGPVATYKLLTVVFL